MDAECSALIRSARETRRAAQGARERARNTRVAVAVTRARLGTASLELRNLAVRRLIAGCAPDRLLWAGFAVRQSATVSAPASQATGSRAV